MYVVARCENIMHTMLRFSAIPHDVLAERLRWIHMGYDTQLSLLNLQPVNTKMTTPAHFPPDKVAPGQGLNLMADDLLNRLFPSGEEVPAAVKKRLENLREELRQPIHHGRDVRRASKIEYDRWIEDIFRAVVDGTRRETMVEEFLE